MAEPVRWDKLGKSARPPGKHQQPLGSETRGVEAARLKSRNAREMFDMLGIFLIHQYRPRQAKQSNIPKAKQSPSQRPTMVRITLDNQPFSTSHQVWEVPISWAANYYYYYFFCVFFVVSYGAETEDGDKTVSYSLCIHLLLLDPTLANATLDWLIN